MSGTPGGRSSSRDGVSPGETVVMVMAKLLPEAIGPGTRLTWVELGGGGKQAEINPPGDTPSLLRSSRQTISSF